MTTPLGDRTLESKSEHVTPLLVLLQRVPYFKFKIIIESAHFSPPPRACHCPGQCHLQSGLLQWMADCSPGLHSPGCSQYSSQRSHLNIKVRSDHCSANLQCLPPTLSKSQSRPNGLKAPLSAAQPLTSLLLYTPLPLTL